MEMVIIIIYPLRDHGMVIIVYILGDHVNKTKN
jgi:hypothetical protein